MRDMILFFLLSLSIDAMAIQDRQVLDAKNPIHKCLNDVVRYCVAIENIKLIVETTYPKEVCSSSNISSCFICATAKEEVCWYKVRN